jgi:uncharacterized protein YjbI with pentapeptide repeats
MHDYWHEHYKTAAREFLITEGHDLAVGFKITKIDGTTHGGYYWRQVNALHDEPVLHVATNWDPENPTSCPATEGDGLCVAVLLSKATSGGVSLTACVGHVLVYPADLTWCSEEGKLRAPWVIDVDCFDVLQLVRLGLVTDLRDANLQGANLQGAYLQGANLQGAYLQGANLQYANLQYANLQGANLQYANLQYANLQGANLQGAYLQGANLQYANLQYANLQGANLQYANLQYANLQGAYLQGAYLQYANLQYANLQGANLQGVRGLKQ